MFKNYLKILMRNMRKHKDYSLINLFGLTLGMATCILILLYVRYEFSWNKSYLNSDRIYRIQQKVLFKDHQDIYTQTGYPLAQELKRYIPEIEEETVMREVWGEYLSTSDELTFWETRGYYAHNSVFKVFSFQMLKGNPQNALSDKRNSAAIYSWHNKQWARQ